MQELQRFIIVFFSTRCADGRARTVSAASISASGREGAVLLGFAAQSQEPRDVVLETRKRSHRWCSDGEHAQQVSVGGRRSGRGT